MTLKEAYKILGISKMDDDREIKTKYKKLLIMYHPDSDPSRKRKPDDDEKIRQIIEAYKKIKESEGKPVLDTYEFTWDAIENKSAFSERNIYVQFKMYDEELPLSKMARGKFVWDPDMEEFSLFSKSVLEACKEVITDYDVMPTAGRIKGIFHLMMQEYVLPADSARKIGKLVREDKDNEVYHYNGYIKNNISETKALNLIIGEPADIILKDERAVACDIVTGKIIGDISFDQDELYYVVLPLLKNHQVEAHAILKKIENSRRGCIVKVIIELVLPKMLTDRAVSNDMLIKQLLKEK